MTKKFQPDDAHQLMAEICAEWVNELDITMTAIHENGADFLWHAPDGLCRVVDEQTKIVSGQATMAVADTCGAMSLWAINGGLVNATTVEMSTNFMRPLFAGDIEVEMRALSSGKRVVTFRCDFRQAGQGKLAASASAVFMYI